MAHFIFSGINTTAKASIPNITIDELPQDQSTSNPEQITTHRKAGKKEKGEASTSQEKHLSIARAITPSITKQKDLAEETKSPPSKIIRK